MVMFTARHRRMAGHLLGSVLAAVGSGMPGIVTVAMLSFIHFASVGIPSETAVIWVIAMNGHRPDHCDGERSLELCGRLAHRRSRATAGKRVNPEI